MNMLEALAQAKSNCDISSIRFKEEGNSHYSEMKVWARPLSYRGIGWAYTWDCETVISVPNNGRRNAAIIPSALFEEWEVITPNEFCTQFAGEDDNE